MTPELYFLQHDEYFWQFEESHAVIGNPWGKTIAYTELVAGILRGLADGGLPRFGSILLVLVATNPDAENELRIIQENLVEYGSDEQSISMMEAVMPFLKRLSGLPQKYREGDGRVLLLQTIFEQGHKRVSVSKSWAIVTLCVALPGRLSPLLTATFSPEVLHNDLRPLELASRKFPDKESILQAMQQLPELEEVPELDTSETPGKEKTFLEKLLEDSRSFPVAALVPRLWSGLNIPFHNVLPSAQPVGGISDLTNKGGFDRLLLSEFANEDLLFMTRLANNEALYIHREVPPEDNDMERVMLLDISIKNWGTPKTIAHALMLAIAKHPKTDIHCRAFAVGDECRELHFKTVDDIISNLQHVEPSLHAANGIEQYFTENINANKREIVFISAAEAMEVPRMHRLLSDRAGDINYWIATSRTGRVDVYKKQKNSKRHIQHLQLPLDDLWQNPPAEKPSMVKVETAHQYPILFPGPQSFEYTLFGAPGEVYFKSSDRSLLQVLVKDRGNAGMRMITERLPYKKSAWHCIGADGDQSPVLLLVHSHTQEFTLIHLKSGERYTGKTGESTPEFWKRIYFAAGAFYLEGRANHYKISLPGTGPGSINSTVENTGHDGMKPLLTMVSLHDLPEQEKSQDLVSLHPLFFRKSVLRNIHSLYINSRGNLVLNTKELTLSHNNLYVKLGPVENKEVAVSARRQDDRLFVFPNGSSLFMHRAGMMVLQEQAGNGLFEMVLQHTGAAPLSLLLHLRQNFGMDLSEAKKHADNVPSVLRGSISRDEGEKLKQALLHDCPDAQVIVREASPSCIFIPTTLDASLAMATKEYFAGNKYYEDPNHSLTKLNTEDFWKQYIVSFTQKIVQHGA